MALVPRSVGLAPFRVWAAAETHCYEFLPRSVVDTSHRRWYGGAMTSRRTRIRSAFLLAAGLLTGAAVIGATASATPPVDLHCPSHNVAPNIKDESGSNDNDLIPAEGTVICVKASTGNTGVITADGETTLREYLFDAGIVDGSGYKGRDVSYWVTYPPTTTTTEGEETTTTTVVEETTTTTVPEQTTTTLPPEIDVPVVIVRPSGSPTPAVADPVFTG